MKTPHARKIYRIAGIALLVIAAAAAVAYAKGWWRLRSPIVFLSQPQRTITTQGSVAEENRSGAFDRLQEVSGGDATRQVSYQEALQLYSGRVMQLDQNCRANPVIMSLPVKSVIMVDNRSPWQRSLIVGSRTYSIAPSDYILASFNVPGQFAVTCDSVQNVSIISVQ